MASESGATTDRRPDREYDIRPYEPGDRSGFLSLYDEVFGGRVEGWFEWKYESNPYVDHVPMIVATHEGTLVGAKPCFALELTAGQERLLGLQPADVMVHPHHRRRGLYSKTTERLKHRYTDSEVDLFFNYPNAATLQGSIKHGWRIVETVPTWYRIHEPTEFLGETRWDRFAPAIRAGTRSYLTLRDQLTGEDNSITVQRFQQIPVSSFVDLYGRQIPAGFHATRDRQFYRWRYDNPRWRYRAYLARHRDSVLAGLITASGTEGQTRLTRIVDVVPLAPTPGRLAGLRALFHRVIDTASSSDLIAASGHVVPDALLREMGFVSDRRLPLRLVASPTVQVTYPLAPAGHPWTVGGRAITDPNNWRVTFAEQDSG